jgi:hypothetical protein
VKNIYWQGITFQIVINYQSPWLPESLRSQTGPCHWLTKEVFNRVGRRTVCAATIPCGLEDGRPVNGHQYYRICRSNALERITNVSTMRAPYFLQGVVGVRIVSIPESFTSSGCGSGVL